MPTTNRIYVLGAHPLALGYYEKISRARDHLQFDGLFCVSDSPARETLARIAEDRIISQKPHEFIADYILDPSRHDDGDIIIPDHTARHVLLETFLAAGMREFPDRGFHLTPLNIPIATPFVHRGEDGAIIAMSYATWTCPPDCDEPAECPHIKAPRDWDFFASLPEMLADIPEPASRHIFGCKILVDEIACLSSADIRREWDVLRTRIGKWNHLVAIIATHSHCHGIVGGFTVTR